MITLPNICGDFVIGKNECTYQRIIEDFCNSAFVGVVTYNISSKDDSKLLEALKQAAHNGSQVVLITNIPKRFLRYYKDSVT